MNWKLNEKKRNRKRNEVNYNWWQFNVYIWLHFKFDDFLMKIHKTTEDGPYRIVNVMENIGYILDYMMFYYTHTSKEREIEIKREEMMNDVVIQILSPCTLHSTCQAGQVLLFKYPDNEISSLKFVDTSSFSIVHIEQALNLMRSITFDIWTERILFRLFFFVHLSFRIVKKFVRVVSIIRVFLRFTDNRKRYYTENNNEATETIQSIEIFTIDNFNPKNKQRQKDIHGIVGPLIVWIGEKTKQALNSRQWICIET